MTKIIRINSEGERKVRAITESPKEKWIRCVKECKLLVMSREQSRLKICELTLEACDIKLGGGGHWEKFKNQYHVGKFAEDIGVNSKTLRNWMLVYRYVFLKLPKDERKSFKWRHGELVRRKCETRKMNPRQVTTAYLKSKHSTNKENHNIVMEKYISHITSGLKKMTTKDRNNILSQLQALIDSYKPS